MTTDDKFNQIYQSILAENADAMELARKEAKTENRHNIIEVTAVILISMFIVSASSIVIREYAAGLIWIFVIAALAICEKIVQRGGKSKIEKYKMDFKTKIVGTMIKSFEEQLEYTPKNGLSMTEFYEAEFEKFDKYYSEDLIHGTLKNNCKFEMAEVLTEDEYTDEDGGTKYSKILFSGLFAKMETPKPFNTLLYIRKDKKDKSLLSKVLSWKLPFDKLRIQLDSQEFEKIFDVYASDHIIAMQLLTADVMQELIQFYNEMGIDYELTIKKNCLYIRFWCGPMFEILGYKKSSLDKDVLYMYYRMLDFTFNLSDKMLKLLNETLYN